MRLEWLAWSNPVAVWWVFLVGVSAVNLALLGLLHWYFRQGRSAAERWTFKLDMMIVLCAAYVLGCAFRATLPRADNIHYLGRKAYQELPDYVASWDVAIMPFALNEATRFISPTKTPEYLAAGKPVVSTPILDVVRGWGMLDGVRIARGAAEFVAEAETALALWTAKPDWLSEVDRELAGVSWDRTWSNMAGLIAGALQRNVETEGGWRVSRRGPRPRVTRLVKIGEPEVSEAPVG